MLDAGGMTIIALPLRSAPDRAFRSALAAAPPDESFRGWLDAHSDALFGWTMALTPAGESRRAQAEVAVSIQRLSGRHGYLGWLLAAATQLAHRAAPRGLAETGLNGLPPELRAVLRLVAQGDWPPAQVMSLLDEPMGPLRKRLVLACLQC